METQGLVDDHGDRRYEVRHEVAVFQPRDFVDAESAARLDRLNQRARHVGFLAAIRDADGRGEGPGQYVVDPARHGYVDHLPIGPTSRVLEIGCSLGQCTSILAKRAAEVWAIDVVRGQAEFTLVRCRQEGSSNVHVAAGGEDGRLPYRDGCFDVVILNLVLEWCGVRSSEDHVIVQRRMLAEIARVLRPGGCAWISTKNRFAMRLLLGGRDEHMSGMRFGSALPGWLAGTALARRGSSRADGRLHSHRGLRRLILDAGFESTEAFWAIPDMRHPRRFTRADSSAVRAVRAADAGPLATGRIVSRIMSALPAFVVPHVAPGNSFIATKSGRSSVEPRSVVAAGGSGASRKDQHEVTLDRKVG